MQKALEDIVVLDLGQIYNGPYCTLMLAYQGATVIKIEPLTGEILHQRVHDGEITHSFLMMNSNKYGMALDLKSEEGRNLFLELVKKADVLVENFSLNTMAKLGLDYSTLKEINPRLIYATGKGYGLDGPYANLPAMDVTIQAISGVVTSTGFPEGPPVKTGVAVADFMGGIHLFGGITTALYQREKTGKGQLVEVSMHDTIYPTLASPLAAHYSKRDDIPERTGNRHSGLAIAPYNIYPTSDGFIAIFCITQKHWENLVTYMNQEDLLTDPRFNSNVNRSKHIDDVDIIVGEWTIQRKKMELVQELREANVPCSPILSIQEVAEDEHLIARKMIRKVTHPIAGEVSVPGSPIRLYDSPLDEVRPAPLIGEHTDWILKRFLNISDEDLSELHEKNVIK
ncbi:CoA transferase [Lysinibacillus yapensis]|uniref:CoA transferase n=1 Tax=Ureibacillus yapensis TaxID=2304605 RepID=A0A396S8Q2_9BACL|nr:CoA transferase [Lysinibacillus yapensis]RHW37465.1 CoA transferase [Lysinibacillus yapensis]